LRTSDGEVTTDSVDADLTMDQPPEDPA